MCRPMSPLALTSAAARWAVAGASLNGYAYSTYSRRNPVDGKSELISAGSSTGADAGHELRSASGGADSRVRPVAGRLWPAVGSGVLSMLSTDFRRLLAFGGPCGSGDNGM